MNLVFNLEASSGEGIIHYAQNFVWPHGEKVIRKRLRQGGLILAVTESWYPTRPLDYGCILEDDIEVSRHYFAWITKAVVALRETPDPRVVGISLYSPRITETTNPKKRFNSTALVRSLRGKKHDEMPYMLQTPCSWGAVYFPVRTIGSRTYQSSRACPSPLYFLFLTDHPRNLMHLPPSQSPWMEFLRYIKRRSASTAADFEIPGSRTNGWKQSWKKYHFEFLYIKGYYLLYPNFHGQHSLSTNRMEKGEHIMSTQRDDSDFQVPLLRDRKPLERLVLPDLSLLPVLDLFGEPWLTEDELLRRTLRQMAVDVKGVPPTFLKRKSSQKLSILLAGNSISSSSGSILISDSSTLSTGDGESEATTVHYGVPQPDGQFAIYRDFRNVDVGTLLVWHTNSYVGEPKDCDMEPCYSYTLSLTLTGSLRLEQRQDKPGLESTTEATPSLLWASPPDPTPRASAISGSSGSAYYAKLEGDGRLVVYRKHTPNCTLVVWESAGLNETSQTPLSKGPTMTCVYKFDDRYSCATKESTYSLFDSSSVTLIISTHSRFELLAEQLAYYSKSPVVSTIVVTWHHREIPAPRHGRVQGTYIRFESPRTDSLNNRFMPLHHIATDAVLIIDDDIKLHLQDVQNMLAVWRLNRHNLVGVSARWVDNEEQRSPENAAPGMMRGGSGEKLKAFNYRYQSEDGPDFHEGYSLILTRAMVMHRDYLHLYSCGGKSKALGVEEAEFAPAEPLRRLILETVDRNFNCEDIGMNFIVNAALTARARTAAKIKRTKPEYVIAPTERAAPLFVKPLHMIGDFGKMGTSGLHLKKTHLSTRSKCLNTMNQVLFAIFGRNLPAQLYFIDAAAMDAGGNHSVEFTKRRSSRHPLTKRLHADCLEVKPGPWTWSLYNRRGSDPCSFQLPTRKDYTRSPYWRVV